MDPVSINNTLQLVITIASLLGMIVSKFILILALIRRKKENEVLQELRAVTQARARLLPAKRISRSPAVRPPWSDNLSTHCPKDGPA